MLLHFVSIDNVISKYIKLLLLYFTGANLIFLFVGLVIKIARCFNTFLFFFDIKCVLYWPIIIFFIFSLNDLNYVISENTFFCTPILNLGGKKLSFYKRIKSDSIFNKLLKTVVFTRQDYILLSMV